MSEVAWFDADEIQAALDRDLAAGLRMLACAIESGQLDGRLVSAEGFGGPRHDPRVHVLVKIDVAAPVYSLDRRPAAAQLPAKVEE